jgi:hypothetical protein
MIDLPPALKADLSLILQELVKDTGGLLDIKLSEVSGWCNDKAIDLDSLCSYVANLCGEKQIDFEQLRTSTDNIIRSGATTKQFLELVDDLEPELLKELVTQASIASTELEEMNNEAGGNKTFHWIANHPFASAGIGLGAVVVTGGIVHKLRQIRQAERFVDNGAQHVENGVNDLNERLVEGVNTHVDHEITNIPKLDRNKLDKHIANNDKTMLKDALSMEVRHKLPQGLEISRSEPYFQQGVWNLETEAGLLMGAHYAKWPEQEYQIYQEYSGPMLRILHPYKYLNEFRHWEREEKRKADKLVVSDVSELIDHDQSDMQHLEKRELLKVEDKVIHEEANVLIENSNYNLDEEFSRNKLPKFDIDKTLKAEAELAKIERAGFDKFENSDYFAELFNLMKEDDARFWDFGGMVQTAVHDELTMYYKFDNSKYFDSNFLPNPNGEGVIKLDKDIIQRYRSMDSQEVRAVRDEAYRKIFIDTKQFKTTDAWYYASVDSRWTEFFADCEKMFGTVHNIDKWLVQQENMLERYGISLTSVFNKYTYNQKLKLVGRVLEYRVQEDFIGLRSEAYSTLKQYSGKAEQDLTKAEHDIMNKAFKDLERSNMIASYFKSEFDAAVKTLESEAAALLNDGKKEADALMQASERDAADILKSVEII